MTLDSRINGTTLGDVQRRGVLYQDSRGRVVIPPLFFAAVIGAGNLATEVGMSAREINPFTRPEGWTTVEIIMPTILLLRLNVVRVLKNVREAYSPPDSLSAAEVVTRVFVGLMTDTTRALLERFGIGEDNIRLRNAPRPVPFGSPRSTTLVDEYQSVSAVLHPPGLGPTLMMNAERASCADGFLPLGTGFGTVQVKKTIATYLQLRLEFAKAMGKARTARSFPGVSLEKIWEEAPTPKPSKGNFIARANALDRFYGDMKGVFVLMCGTYDDEQCELPDGVVVMTHAQSRGTLFAFVQ
jgi:hypothetical protein